MNLVNCPKCNGMTDGEKPTCVRCGASTQGGKRRERTNYNHGDTDVSLSGLKAIGWVIMIVIGIVMIAIMNVDSEWGTGLFAFFIVCLIVFIVVGILLWLISYGESPSHPSSEPTAYTASSESIKCPRCNSTQITASKKGFGVGKAAAGLVIAGPVGLAAGAIGASKIKVTCLNCGGQWVPGKH